MPTDPHAAARRVSAQNVMERLYRVWADVHPMISHHSTARWEMSLAWYREIRALSVVAAGGDEPTPEEMAKWEISKGDAVLGLPITEGQGDPVIVADAPPPIRLEDYLPGMKDPSWTYERQRRETAVDLGEWIKRQMVTDARTIQETIAGPPDTNAEAEVAHQIRRRILKLHGWDDPHTLGCEVCEATAPWAWPCETVRLVILIWANRVGYDPRWAPEMEGS